MFGEQKNDRDQSHRSKGFTARVYDIIAMPLVVCFACLEVFHTSGSSSSVV